MTFLVRPSGGRFMGRFSEPLATEFADACGVGAGASVLDVGCGPGALTAELVRRLGPDAVTAIDPSPPFVEAVAARFRAWSTSASGPPRISLSPTTASTPSWSSWSCTSWPTRSRGCAR